MYEECQSAQLAVGGVTEAEDDVVSEDEVASGAGESSSDSKSDDGCESDGADPKHQPCQASATQTTMK